jgi:hypothetical protein
LLSKNQKDFTNISRNRLTLLLPTEKDKHGRYLWMAKCSCGTYLQVLPNSVLSENTKSCGCLFKEQVYKSNKARTKHGYYTKESKTIANDDIRSRWRKASSKYRKTDKGFISY